MGPKDKAMEELPLAYAVALRLHAAGADEETVAQALGLPVESVGRVLSIAQSKLDAALARTSAERDEQ